MDLELRCYGIVAEKSLEVEKQRFGCNCLWPESQSMVIIKSISDNQINRWQSNQSVIIKSIGDHQINRWPSNQSMTIKSIQWPSYQSVIIQIEITMIQGDHWVSMKKAATMSKMISSRSEKNFQDVKKQSQQINGKRVKRWKSLNAFRTLSRSQSATDNKSPNEGSGNVRRWGVVFLSRGGFILCMCFSCVLYFCLDAVLYSVCFSVLYMLFNGN